MVRSLFGRLAGPSLRTRVLWLVLAALVLVGLAGWLTINRIIESLTFQFGTMIAERQVQYDRYRGMAALGREISLAGALSRSPAILEWFADENGEAAEARGLRIGRDLSVIAYDGIPEAATATPPLTTFAVDTRAAGARLAKLLFARIRGADLSHLREVVPAHLIARGSDGPPPNTEPGPARNTGPTPPTQKGET